MSLYKAQRALCTKCGGVREGGRTRSRSVSKVAEKYGGDRQAAELNAKTRAHVERLTQLVAPEWKKQTGTDMDADTVERVRAMFRSAIDEYTGAGFLDINRMLQDAHLNQLNPNSFSWSRAAMIVLLMYLVHLNDYAESFEVWRWNADRVTSAVEKLPSVASAQQALQVQAQRAALIGALQGQLAESRSIGTLLANLASYEKAPAVKNRRRAIGMVYQSKAEGQDDIERNLLRRDGKGSFAEVKRLYEANRAVLGATPPPSPFSEWWGPVRDRLQPGETFLTAPFTSTSLDRAKVDVYAGVKDARGPQNCCVLSIFVPAGFPCLYIEGKNERELLLPPCTEFIVLSGNIDGNPNYVRLRAVQVYSLIPQLPLVVTALRSLLRSGFQIGPELEPEEVEQLRVLFYNELVQNRCSRTRTQL